MTLMSDIQDIALITDTRKPILLQPLTITAVTAVAVTLEEIVAAEMVVAGAINTHSRITAKKLYLILCKHNSDTAFAVL